MDWPVSAPDEFGCTLWTGRRDRDGYGRTPDGQLAHRAAYEAEHGPIPEGKEVEHGCRRRSCVRIEHLELFTRSEQEKAKRFGWSVRKRSCAKGHDMSHAAITPEGGRCCRECSRPAPQAAWVPAKHALSMVAPEARRRVEQALAAGDDE